MTGTLDIETRLDPMALKQGDLRLLETDLAQRLLASRIPARVGYITEDGKPRVVATWFYWTGEVLSMPAFLSAPHLRHPPRRLRALWSKPDIAVTIDTETFPPEVLSLRGQVEISVVDGIPATTPSRRGASSETTQPGSTSPASIVPAPRWRGSTCGPPGSACTTFRHVCRARSAESRDH